MKKLAVWIILVFTGIFSMAQDKKDLAITLSGGIFNTPYYYKAIPGRFIKLSFSYQLSERSILSSEYLSGNHRYLDEHLTNLPGPYYSDGTNSKAIYQVFSIVYKHRLIDHEKFSIIPGAGAGIFTHSRDYPYNFGTYSAHKTSTWSDLVFPFSLDVHFKLSSHFQLGATGGFLIHPDYPVIGLNAGPSVTYIIK